MMRQAAKYAIFWGLLMLWVNGNSVDAQTDRAFTGYRSFMRTCKGQGFSGRCCRTKFRCERCSPAETFPYQSSCSDRRLQRCADRKTSLCEDTFNDIQLGGQEGDLRCQRKGTGSGTSYPLCDAAARGECNAFTCAEQKNFNKCYVAPIRARAVESGETVMDQYCWADEICGCPSGLEEDGEYFGPQDDRSCCRD